MNTFQVWDMILRKWIINWFYRPMWRQRKHKNVNIRPKSMLISTKKKQSNRFIYGILRSFNQKFSYFQRQLSITRAQCHTYFYGNIWKIIDGCIQCQTITSTKWCVIKLQYFKFKKKINFARNDFFSSNFANICHLLFTSEIENESETET